jgi:hypothetical protein
LFLCRRRGGKRRQNQRRHRQVDIRSRYGSHLRSMSKGLKGFVAQAFLPHVLQNWPGQVSPSGMNFGSKLP